MKRGAGNTSGEDTVAPTKHETKGFYQKNLFKDAGRALTWPRRMTRRSPIDLSRPISVCSAPKRGARAPTFGEAQSCSGRHGGRRRCELQRKPVAS